MGIWKTHDTTYNAPKKTSIKKKDSNNCWRESEKFEPAYIAGGNIK